MSCLQKIQKWKLMYTNSFSYPSISSPSILCSFFIVRTKMFSFICHFFTFVWRLGCCYFCHFCNICFCSSDWHMLKCWQHNGCHLPHVGRLVLNILSTWLLNGQTFDMCRSEYFVLLPFMIIIMNIKPWNSFEETIWNIF